MMNFHSKEQTMRYKNQVNKLHEAVGLDKMYLCLIAKEPTKHDCSVDLYTSQIKSEDDLAYIAEHSITDIESSALIFGAMINNRNFYNIIVEALDMYNKAITDHNKKRSKP